MKAGKQPVIYKENGKKQRGHILLDKELAGALVEMIFEGKTLYPQDCNHIELNIRGKKEKLSKNTIKDWVVRENVIPETGKKLRDLLSEAKIEVKKREVEKRAKNMVEKAEDNYDKALKLETKETMIGAKGIILKDKDTNNVIKRENPNLLKIKMEASKFVLESLASDRYGKVEKTENKHLIFSLSDLAKEKERIETEENEAQN